MRRFCLALILVLVSSHLAAAGTYTITTTPQQDAALAWRVAQANNALPPGTPPMTVAQFVQQWISDLLAVMVSQHQSVKESELASRVKQAPPAVQQEIEQFIKSKLGLP